MCQNFFFKAKYSIICIYHILFIHSSVEGHLGYFRLLSVVSNDALKHGFINILSPCFQFFWIYSQRWNYWIIWLSLFNFFEEPPYCFSIVTIPFYILTNGAQEFLFLIFWMVAILKNMRWYLIVVFLLIVHFFVD